MKTDLFQSCGHYCHSFVLKQSLSVRFSGVWGVLFLQLILFVAGKQLKPRQNYFPSTIYQWFSHSRMPQQDLKSLLENRLLDSAQSVSYLRSLGWEPRICMIQMYWWDGRSVDAMLRLTGVPSVRGRKARNWNVLDFKWQDTERGTPQVSRCPTHYWRTVER